MTNPWQPIETAPLDGTYVDLWLQGPLNPGNRCPDCWYDCGQWWHDYGRDGNLNPADWVGDAPAYWMPRPESPES